MNCNEVTRLLLKRAEQTDTPLPFPAQAHLQTCEECRALQRSLETDRPDPEPASNWARRIDAEMAGTLQPVSPLPSAPVLVLRTSAVFVLLPVLAVAAMGVTGARAMSGWQLSAGLGLIAVSEILLSLSLCSLMVPGCIPLIPFSAGIAGTLIVFPAAMLALFPTAESWLSPARGLRCLLLGWAVAALAAGWLFLLARKGAVFSWTSTGAVAGLLAGLAGATALHIECGFLDGGHRAFWHGGILASSTLTGLAIGALHDRQRRISRFRDPA